MFALHGFKTAPPFQSGEYLAFQMENDPNTASLLQFFTTPLTLVIRRLWQSCVRMFLFLALMNPLVPISRGMLSHLKPFPWMVVVSSLYLSAFLEVAASIPVLNINDHATGGRRTKDILGGPKGWGPKKKVANAEIYVIFEVFAFCGGRTKTDFKDRGICPPCNCLSCASCQVHNVSTDIVYSLICFTLQVYVFFKTIDGASVSLTFYLWF